MALLSGSVDTSALRDLGGGGHEVCDHASSVGTRFPSGRLRPAPSGRDERRGGIEVAWLGTCPCLATSQSVAGRIEPERAVGCEAPGQRMRGVAGRSTRGNSAPASVRQEREAEDVGQHDDPEVAVVVRGDRVELESLGRRDNARVDHIELEVCVLRAKFSDPGPVLM